MSTTHMGYALICNFSKICIFLLGLIHAYACYQKSVQFEEFTVLVYVPTYSRSEIHVLLLSFIWFFEQFWFLKCVYAFTWFHHMNKSVFLFEFIARMHLTQMIIADVLPLFLPDSSLCPLSYFQFGRWYCLLYYLFLFVVSGLCLWAVYCFSLSFFSLVGKGCLGYFLVLIL